MSNLIFAANWKMNQAPADAAAFLRTFTDQYARQMDRRVLFFPPAVSLHAVVQGIRERADLEAGVQNLHWEDKGAFTGETSGPLARAAGARHALVGHSERRHVFGETDAETGKKVAAAFRAGLTPTICVGETLAQREAGETEAVCARQLQAALAGVAPSADLVIAYEPVWAIGTGKVARPQDASDVHREIRTVLHEHRVQGRIPVLYGGSVNLANVEGLLAEDEIDGVLVGGASLEAEGWAAIVAAGA